MWKTIWTKQAKNALKSIYDYYKDKSLQGAKNVTTELLESPKTIRFAKQYQLDNINPKYRRIIIRDYKVLYREAKESIYIVDIVNTKQSPEVLKKK
ncbi:MAG: type II toxin-antitoxin system RelE/ParE family toxin [Bacteroidetes bacterium]|jgi:addiction module RelE/StbE family toxin|nr:type II toxin-antitoxin system RelE/ParE family toxin [Bacteroidota bacterium]MBT5528455.1 type II toxin-antitoxin system RelE/ParE family toxin [Cytophagia bacterium]MBT3800509.1 type II toxin-antitoxin system RelE/ParE family toxin [Bacteroidota bacterium]MBT3932968.1 type II toxin-antitoxin system RelE/ParE family toxin [Bacteroidota bacterium]MBT4338104.1 type II toxin-antitoxin system RelE/ParE family toxin [Bacteroidota bacterium]